MKKSNIIIFGEVLFDCFSDGAKVLGGAPFNVAWHLQAFGQFPYFISRIGQDRDGKAILSAMQDWGMKTNGVQQDPLHDTGKVLVTLEDGEPHYDIVAGVAYDFIEQTTFSDPEVTTLYHGTLGLRNPVSLKALEALKAQGLKRIFMDVNLREPWWQREAVLEWVAASDWVKLNYDELIELQGVDGNLIVAAEAFRQKYRLEGLIVTKGEQGAVVLVEKAPPLEVVPKRHDDIVDTVGAGDAFSSVLLMGLNQQWPLSRCLERAQAFASAIVGQRGATVSNRSFYRPFLSQWNIVSKHSQS
jgi:fructokinase